MVKVIPVSAETFAKLQADPRLQSGVHNRELLREYCGYNGPFIGSIRLVVSEFTQTLSPAPCVMGQTDSTPSGETVPAESSSPAKK